MVTGGYHAAAVARAALTRLPLVVLLVIVIVALTSAFMLLCRYEQERRAANGAPARVSAAYGDEVPSSEQIAAEVSYTCIDAPGREVVSRIVWDDSWAFADPYAYHHELARTCSVFSALTYAESSHYQKSYRTPPYLEQAFEKLGFDEVSTVSYEYRSEVADQVLNLATRQEDTVAFGLARKRVVDAEGSPCTVIVLSIRGSYGSEWLSNLKLMDGRADGAAATEHRGYTEAADEVCAALASWVSACHKRGDAVTLLVTGHSRGGAIANLVAARADDELAQENDGPGIGLREGDRVVAYTFASPGCTTDDDVSDARYGNIFNIVNPADLMPSLPPASWGYARYGMDLALPSVDDEGFSDRFGAMRAAYTELTGKDDPYDPEAAHAIQSVVDEVSARVGSVEELATPNGVVTVLSACASHINPVRILGGHYPSVYISWMYAVEGDDLAPARC